MNKPIKHTTRRICRKCAFCCPKDLYCSYQDRDIGQYFMNHYACKDHLTEEELANAMRDTKSETPKVKRPCQRRK